MTCRSTSVEIDTLTRGCRISGALAEGGSVEKKTALNSELERLLEEMATKEGTTKEDVLLKSVGLLKYLKDNDVKTVTGLNKAGETAAEVAL
jgi:hypothetical protein